MIGTLEEAQAACRAAGVDLRVSGKGSSACADRLFPFCPFGVDIALGVELPTCAAPPPSPRKAAILLAEAEARAGAPAGPPWLLLGGGALVAGFVLWLAVR